MSLQSLVPKLQNRLWARFMDEMIFILLVIPFFPQLWNPGEDFQELSVTGSQMLIALLLPVTLESLSLYFFGTTPGKYIFRMKVVSQNRTGSGNAFKMKKSIGGESCQSTNGEHPKKEELNSLCFSQAMLRSFSRRLDLIFSWSIYTLALFRYDRTHLLDWMAQTRVEVSEVLEKKSPDRAVENQNFKSRGRIFPVVGSLLTLIFLENGLERAFWIFSSLEINWSFFAF